MSADDTYIVRYEPSTDAEKPYVVMWRQNYWDYEHHYNPERDNRFATLYAALNYAHKENAYFTAEYGVVVEDNVPLDPPSSGEPAHKIEGTFDHFERYIG